MAEFMEVESGLKNYRPPTRPCARSVPPVARGPGDRQLDRLARNVAFVARLIESGAEFVAVVQSWPFPLSSGCGLGHKEPTQASNTGSLPS